MENVQVRKEIQGITSKVKTEELIVFDCDVESEVSHEMVDTEQFQADQDDYGYDQSLFK